MGYHTNTDFMYSSTDPSELIIFSTATASGDITWATSFAYPGYAFTGRYMALSIDTTQIYVALTYLASGSTQLPGVLTVKTLDGSFVAFRKFGSSAISLYGISVSPLTNRFFLVGSATSGSFR